VKADKSQPITVSEEHSEFKWCSFKEALNDLRYNKEIFKKAVEEMNENSSN
jgi:hypothetical protein